MGIELVTKRFKNTFYYEGNPDNIVEKEVTGFFFKVDLNHTYFKLGDELALQIRFKHKDSRQLTREGCIPNFYNLGPPKCTIYPIGSVFNFIRDKEGKLRGKNDSSYMLEYAYKRDANFEYFEFYTEGEDILLPYRRFADNDPKHTGASPIIIVTAKNGKGEAEISLRDMILQYASFDFPQPGANAYMPDVPDYRPVLQVGVSGQVPGIDVNVAVTTDFRDITVTIEPGLSINKDIEIEAFVNAYCVENLSDVTVGLTKTVSGDLGPVGLGGSTMFNDQNSLIGVGVTLGKAGVIDTDVSLNYPVNWYSTADAATNTGGGYGGGNHNPNYGGPGDTHHGNDGNSGHAGGTSENSDGGTGVNTSWGGRSDVVD